MQLGRQSPFETREQTLLNILHIHQRFVWGQDDLFAVLVQVVEDVEKYILLPRFARELYVINDQNINELVKWIKSLRLFFLTESMYCWVKISLEMYSFGFLRIFVFNFYADSVGKVGLPQTNTTQK